MIGTTILLIRHGETDWNREKRFRGHYNIPLNENGRSQARLLADALEAINIDIVYSSPLSRALETAKLALKDRNPEIIKEDDLRDIDYGHWTGIKESEVESKWPHEYEEWKKSPHKLRIPGGNSLEDIYNTAFKAFKDIAVKQKGRTVAVFAHRVVNKILIIGSLELGLDRFSFIRQDNCCINIFEYDGSGFTLSLLNDTCHMKDRSVDLLRADF